MGYKKYIDQATTINTQDSWNNRQYLVGIWQGSGYLMDLFIVWAPDAEDVLDILTNYFVRKDITRFFVNVDNLSNVDLMTAEEYGDIVYTENGYIYGENLSIEEI